MTTLAASLYGYFIANDLRYPIYGAVLGFIVAFVLSVPNYPYFNRHPITWQPAAVDDDSSAIDTATSTSTAASIASSTNTTSTSKKKSKKST
jgi:hypothetical protein